MVQERLRRMGEDSIPRLLWSFSAPAIVGMLAQALYNVIDRAIVGRALGPDGIAGITLAFPFMLIQAAFGMLVGMGTTALVSIRLGQRRKEDAEQILGNAVILLLCVGAILAVIGNVFLDNILTLSGSSPHILPLAHQYTRVIAMGTFFPAVGFGLNAVIRGEGSPRIAMLTMLIGVFLNAILAPVFVFGLHCGMRGAALATVLAQGCSATWVLSHFLGGRSYLKLRASNMRLRWQTCSSIIVTGSPMFAMQLAASVVTGLFNRRLRTYGGDMAISVMGIIFSGVMMFTMIVIGINQGVQPIIGFNYGARKPHRVRMALLTAILAATGVVLVGFSLMMFFPGAIFGLFTRPDPELLAMGKRAMRMCVAMMPLMGFQMISAAYFQAVGKPRVAMLLALSRQVLMLIPAIVILPKLLGLKGVWLAMPAADLCSSALTALWLALELRHLRNLAGAPEPRGFPVKLVGLTGESEH